MNFQIIKKKEIESNFRYNNEAPRGMAIFRPFIPLPTIRKEEPV